MKDVVGFLASSLLLLALTGFGEPTRAAHPYDPEPPCAAVWYADDDGDGFGVAGESVLACHAPRGFSALPGDCDDVAAEVNPAAPETCNERDDDCDGVPDDAVPLWFRDADADGWGDPTNTWNRCERPEGYTERGGDCDDRDASRSAACER